SPHIHDPQDANGDGVFEWEYDAPGGAPPATGYTVKVDPLVLTAAQEANRYLKLLNYWIGLPNLVNPPDPGEDWPVRLADRVAAAWNLPRLLLDAAGGWPPCRPGISRRCGRRRWWPSATGLGSA